VPGLVLAAVLAAPQARPEIFDIVATATPAGASAAAGGVTVPMTAQIDRYTPEHERVTMTDGLKYDGYKGFLNALRVAPRAGTLEVAGQQFPIRWAREVATATGRTISLVTDQPVFFVGGGRRGAKATAGYEVAVVQLIVDTSGTGHGTMAAAARVKPGGETGVRIDNYAEKPLTLTVTVRGAR
jgi:hypothetical protein